ncbi:MAG: hypothetical protein AUI36_14350 [Cyanobacteria bacterium 13_1_40CM_2_61_4]|nr:MAG: hypothetical protein AUI36_14350 [Cyanobacteria bacterium 13_1_40CM_2_61_4]
MFCQVSWPGVAGSTLFRIKQGLKMDRLAEVIKQNLTMNQHFGLLFLKFGTSTAPRKYWQNEEYLSKGPG